MNALLKNHSHLRRWIIFMIGGGLTTAFTYFIYLSLNFFISYQWAYLIGYFLGVLLAYWFNTVIVFHSSIHWRGFLSYPAIYIIQYLFSALFLELSIKKLSISEHIAPLLVAIAMFPVTYLLNKTVIGWTRKEKNNQSSGTPL